MLEFVYEYYKGSDVSVFWINAGNATDFNLDCRELVKKLLLPGHDNLEILRESSSAG